MKNVIPRYRSANDRLIISAPPAKKERDFNLRWSSSTIGALRDKRSAGYVQAHSPVIVWGQPLEGRQAFRDLMESLLVDFDASGLTLAIPFLLRPAPGLSPSAAPSGAASKRKGLQLALEPLNGSGIAGYVPKP